MNLLPVCVVINDAYAMPLAVMLKSLISNLSHGWATEVFEMVQNFIGLDRGQRKLQYA